MNYTSKPLLLAILLLTACSQKVAIESPTFEHNLQNPFFAERYAEQLVDRIVELKIDQDPLLEDPDIAKTVEDNRTYWLEKAREASKAQRDGKRGYISQMQEYAKGEVLYYDDHLYFDTGFETEPGISVHVYLTTVNDPRDVEFPDETALDLGQLSSPFGAQEYTVPPVLEDPNPYRTVVLWDTTLQRLHAIAQLNQ